MAGRRTGQLRYLRDRRGDRRRDCVQLRAQVADPGQAIEEAKGRLARSLLASGSRSSTSRPGCSGPLLLFAMLVVATMVQLESTDRGSRSVVPFAASLVLFGFMRFADLNSWSLHPFYRQRLCTAFALRRIKTRGDPAAGHAEPRREGEFVPLSETTVMAEHRRSRGRPGRRSSSARQRTSPTPGRRRPVAASRASPSARRRSAARSWAASRRRSSRRRSHRGGNATSRSRQPSRCPVRRFAPSMGKFTRPSLRFLMALGKRPHRRLARKSPADATRSSTSERPQQESEGHRRTTRGPASVRRRGSARRSAKPCSRSKTQREDALHAAPHAPVPAEGAARLELDQRQVPVRQRRRPLREPGSGGAPAPGLYADLLLRRQRRQAPRRSRRCDRARPQRARRRSQLRAGRARQAADDQGRLRGGAMCDRRPQLHEVEHGPSSSRRAGDRQDRLRTDRHDVGSSLGRPCLQEGGRARSRTTPRSTSSSPTRSSRPIACSVTTRPRAPWTRWTPTRKALDHRTRARLSRLPKPARECEAERGNTTAVACPAIAAARFASASRRDRILPPEHARRRHSNVVLVRAHSPRSGES